MAIEVNDYCTVKHSIRLFELNVKQDAEYSWVNDYIGCPLNKWYISNSNNFTLSLRHYSAFNVKELNDLLGDYLIYCNKILLYGEEIYVGVIPNVSLVFASKIESHMKADMLIHLIEIKKTMDLLKSPNLNLDLQKMIKNNI